MTKFLYGKNLANDIIKYLAYEVKKMNLMGISRPHLVIVLLGEDVISKTYVNNKIKDCKNVGINLFLKHLSWNISENELLMLIHELNSDPDVDGFIIQLPLPVHIEQKKIFQAINPDKDVDGLNPLNLGKIVLGIPAFIPATPLGIMTLLHTYSIDIQSKNTVIIGRSTIVGQPLSILLSSKHCNSTVTLTHSYTDDIAFFTRKADIIVAALGVPEFIKGDMIRHNSIIIDVGITTIKDYSYPKGYRVVGDVDVKSVLGKASYLTPVPGGIGPLTRAMLLNNTICAAKKKHGLS